MSRFLPGVRWTLAVDPRHDRCAERCVQRNPFCFGPPFEMPRDIGWETNGARDGRAGFRALSRPASTDVDRDSLCLHAERVRVATELGPVEVHLGHLAQRGTGRLATVLTSHLLHSASSLRR